MVVDLHGFTANGSPQGIQDGRHPQTWEQQPKRQTDRTACSSRSPSDVDPLRSPRRCACRSPSPVNVGRTGAVTRTPTRNAEFRIPAARRGADTGAGRTMSPVGVARPIEVNAHAKRNDRQRNEYEDDSQ